MNEYLRKECKLLKAIQGISYKEIAEYLEIKQDSFYCWIKGYYDLGKDKNFWEKHKTVSFDTLNGYFKHNNVAIANMTTLKRAPE